MITPKTSATPAPQASSSTILVDISVPPPYVARIPNDLLRIPRVNYLTIKESHKEVEGRWIVDPKRPTPSAFIPKVKRGKIPENIHLFSHSKPLTAELALLSDVACKSNLYLETVNAPLTAVIIARENQRFILTAKSHSKDVTVYIPRDYEGLLNLKMSSSRKLPVYSKCIQDRLTPLSAHKGRSQSYLGRWHLFTEANGAGTQSWIGDEAILESTNGTVFVSYIDEMAEEGQLPQQ